MGLTSSWLSIKLEIRLEAQKVLCVKYLLMDEQKCPWSKYFVTIRVERTTALWWIWLYCAQNQLMVFTFWKKSQVNLVCVWDCSDDDLPQRHQLNQAVCICLALIDLSMNKEDVPLDWLLNYWSIQSQKCLFLFVVNKWEFLSTIIYLEFTLFLDSYTSCTIAK